jgi:MFS family permease
MAIGTFLASMDQTIVMASAASIGDELHELQSTSWVSTAYMLSLASFQWVSFSAHLGRRR